MVWYICSYICFISNVFNINRMQSLPILTIRAGAGVETIISWLFERCNIRCDFRDPSSLESRREQFTISGLFFIISCERNSKIGSNIFSTWGLAKLRRYGSSLDSCLCSGKNSINSVVPNIKFDGKSFLPINFSSFFVLNISY